MEPTSGTAWSLQVALHGAYKWHCMELTSGTAWSLQVTLHGAYKWHRMELTRLELATQLNRAHRKCCTGPWIELGQCLVQLK
jgi:hypothetical protein